MPPFAVSSCLETLLTVLLAASAVASDAAANCSDNAALVCAWIASRSVACAFASAAFARSLPPAASSASALSAVSDAIDDATLEEVSATAAAACAATSAARCCFTAASAALSLSALSLASSPAFWNLAIRILASPSEFSPKLLTPERSRGRDPERSILTANPSRADPSLAALDASSSADLALEASSWVLASRS